MSSEQSNDRVTDAMVDRMLLIHEGIHADADPEASSVVEARDKMRASLEALFRWERENR